MFESPHSDVKCALDVRHVRAHVKQQPVAVRAGDFKTVHAREIFHCRVIRFRRTKPRGEFFRREIMMKIRARRIVNVLEKFIQASLITQR